MKVYIPEYICMEDNPWDGRTRYGVHTTLRGALDALKHFSDEDDPLVVTGPLEVAQDDTALPVHRESELPSEEGSLWIFVEELQGA
jgi:hypothetical protein